VKLYAEIFIRKGASIGNFLFIDSQDIAGIDKTPLRQCNNWIMGRQRETHEVERVREVIGKKISEEEIKTLKIGHFIAALGDDLKRVYVLPTGVPEQLGREVALSQKTPDDVRGWMDSQKVKDELTGEERAELERLRVEVKNPRTDPEVEHRIADLERENKALKEREESLLRDQAQMDEALEKLNGENRDLSKRLNELEAAGKLLDALKEVVGVPAPPEVVVPLANANVATDLQVEHPVGSIEVTHVRKAVSVTTDNFLGKVALLYSEGNLPLERFELADVKRIFETRGWGWSNNSAVDALMGMTNSGFLRFVPAGFRKGWVMEITPDEAKAKGILKVKEVVE
jgi:hypothetical protein